MKKLLRDPLLHFVVLGLGLFLLYQVSDQQAGDDEILIDRDALLRHLQYQSVAFDRAQFELFLDDMSARETADLIVEAAREEILYREALALGLDRDDYIIRSRLVQKLRYLAEGFAGDADVLSEEDIAAYFDANRDNYVVDPFITFTHVFFNAERRGWDEARALAETKLQELNDGPVPFDESSAHGDRFPYFVNYIERPPQLIASHLGGEMSDALFQFPADDTLWRGPFESRFGTHLVLITDQQPRRMPDFDEVRDRVAAHAQAARDRDLTDAAIDEIVSRYTIVIGADLQDTGAETEATSP
ncbi:MAG: peptidylprolyl isomerase [Rhodospirillaceae bacterium]|nr:peptidylprolyl isomerase [Rhodospirillaceae bacterium]